jgi:hypothetical protein
MESGEKILSPQESLQVITEAINRTKENYKENSFYFTLWGWLIATASLSFFLLHEYTTFQYYFLPFPVLVTAGIITTLLSYSKRKSISRTETYLSYFFSRLWLVLGISFVVIVFINVSQKLPPFTYTLLLAGIGTLISGLVMKFNPLKIGGILFFISSIVCIYLPDGYKPLLSFIAIIAGYLIPGYLLKSSQS